MFVVRTSGPGLAVDTSVYANREAAVGEVKRRLSVRNSKNLEEWYTGDGDDIDGATYQALVTVTITKVGPCGSDGPPKV